MTRFNMPISDRAAADILAIEGVVSVGEGLHQGREAVIVGVDNPALQNDPAIPATVDGLPVVVEVESRPDPAGARPPLLPDDAAQLPTPVSAEAVRRHRPVRPGISVGHPEVTAGTTSFLATDGASIFQVSNLHVVAPNGRNNAGDPVFQPGPADGGTEADAVGHVVNNVPLAAEGNTVDLAWYEPTVEHAPEILGGPESVTAGTVDPAVGDEVTWIGRTSGAKTARVDRSHVAVEVGESRRVFVDQFRLDRPLQGGDSGSPVLMETENGPVPAGMGFAATDTNGYCNYARNVEGASGLRLLAPEEAADPGRASGLGRRQLAVIGGVGLLLALARRRR